MRCALPVSSVAEIIVIQVAIALHSVSLSLQQLGEIKGLRNLMTSVFGDYDSVGLELSILSLDSLGTVFFFP